MDQTVNRKRRGLLKMLAVGGVSIAAPVALKAAYNVADGLVQESDHATITPEEIARRDENLRQFTSGPEAVKVIGVDHFNTEHAFYDWLARDAGTLAANGTKKVLVEMPEAFAPLFQKIDQMDMQGFVDSYLKKYPDYAQWMKQSSPEEVTAVYQDKIHIYNAARALKAHGIAVIPYDQRDKGDLAAHAANITSFYKSQDALGEKVAERQSKVGSVLSSFYRLATGEPDAIAFDQAAASKKATDALRQEGSPALKDFEDKLAKVLSSEEQNYRAIIDQSSPNENIIVQAGNTHVTYPNGLRQKLEESGRSVRSLTYLHDKEIGDVKAYIYGARNTPTVLPDAVLSHQTGVMTEVPRENRAPEHTAARKPQGIKPAM